MVDVRTLAGQVFHDVDHALIGRDFERGPAELPDIIHADALVEQELDGLDRSRTFLWRAHPLHVCATASGHVQRIVAVVGGRQRVRAGIEQGLHGVVVVDFRRQDEGCRATERRFIGGGGRMVLHEADIRIRFVRQQRLDDPRDGILGAEIDAIIGIADHEVHGRVPTAVDGVGIGAIVEQQINDVSMEHRRRHDDGRQLGSVLHRVDVRASLNQRADGFQVTLLHGKHQRSEPRLGSQLEVCAAFH